MRQSQISKSKKAPDATKQSQSVSERNQNKPKTSIESKNLEKNHQNQAKKTKIVNKRVTKRPAQSRRITRQSKQSQVNRKLSNKSLQQVYREKSYSKRQKLVSRSQNNRQRLPSTLRTNNQNLANQQPPLIAMRIPRMSVPVTTGIAFEEQSQSSQSSVDMNLQSDSSSSSNEQLQNLTINRPNIIGRTPENIFMMIRYLEQNFQRNRVYVQTRHFGSFPRLNLSPQLRWNEHNFDWFFVKNRIIKTEEITEEILQKSIQCPICLQDFVQNGNQTEKKQNTDIMQLFCKHIFHKTCAQKSLKQHKAKCPMCRKDFRDHQIYEQFDVNYKNRFNQRF